MQGLICPDMLDMTDIGKDIVCAAVSVLDHQYTEFNRDVLQMIRQVVFLMKRQRN